MNWCDLNTSHKDIPAKLLDEWTALVATDVEEECYHQFIAQNSTMCWPHDVFFAISKLELSGALVPDFVLVSEKGSLGLEYTLVEIEKPSTSTITKAGNPSAGLTHAEKQVRDWKSWIHTHSQDVSRLFPSKFSHESAAHIKFLVIAGRRDGTSDKQELEKFKVSADRQYDIRSFDFITDNLRSFRARDHCIPNSDSDQADWAAGYFHQFANPFNMAVSNLEWKAFASSPNLIRSHMIGRNIRALNSLMKQNPLFDEFSKRQSGGSRVSSAPQSVDHVSTK